MAAPSTIATRPDTLYPIKSAEEFEEEHLEFWIDPALEEIGRRMIQDVPSFDFLQEFDIQFVWKRRGGIRNGKLVLGTASLPTGAFRFFANLNGLVQLSADHCRDSQATWQTIEAVVFHELCHFDFDPDNRRLLLKNHDFEGFNAELVRYGAWHGDLARMSATVRQLELFRDEPDGA
jgi:hypothetical protein